MLLYILRRLLIAVPTLLFIALVSFWLMHIAPGGPFDMERPMPEVVRANIEAKFHLNEPFIIQFFIYIGNFVQGDLGPSFVYQDFSVTELVAQSWPVSAVLGVISFSISVPLGMLLGTIAALNRNGKLDYLLMSLSMTGVVIPAFVLAPILVTLFSIHLGWLPAGGWEGGQLSFLVLPVLSLAIGSVASIARVMRGAMIETLNQPYIRTAKAKGLSTSYILIHHAMRPSLIPIIAMLGPSFVAVVTGSVIIDIFFSTGGMGQHFVSGALNRDYGLVMGITLIVASLTIFFNLVVDVLYTIIDPRIRV
ncbi:oligopeptide ABC transporter permease OppB [Vibrio brasiliensis]|jgi:oligopeptide transport system permease protein|uniref:Oligopeptide ABC transporter permease n=1 Tax=Vibrio brasiliensis LMG 20546 TaxID=945543 RepID=E8LTG6_9VIBR|nr:oligopeptide ABC transporter permease OppB [Vibrio brasiliensis]EGA66059.1 oligopeptide ABC transporter permease [Vibrio brasiliensis LMG 20546]MCG9647690.1 oligopeptide ABC transporter permease OppB [Vibrio brasiliensis]MCG9752181.1 oligopeptide ABC transporter permease OppB [Vibrio brasiliensis]MCG9781738.1 oligopeptide ABC transporter permease OppB [Vibrio brasiliensis]